jgi:hypothetical protein
MFHRTVFNVCLVLGHSYFGITSSNLFYFAWFNCTSRFKISMRHPICTVTEHCSHAYMSAINYIHIMFVFLLYVHTTEDYMECNVFVSLVQQKKGWGTNREVLAMGGRSIICRFVVID